MSEPHAHSDHDEHSAHLGAYLTVFVALSILTAISFVFYSMLPASTSATLIMVVAVVKAFLVGFIFMHLKSDWPRLYFVIAPVSILAVMMAVVLLPDTVLVWHRQAEEMPVVKKAEKPH